MAKKRREVLREGKKRGRERRKDAQVKDKRKEGNIIMRKESELKERKEFE